MTYKFTKEHKENISKALKGRKLSKKHRKKVIKNLVFKPFLRGSTPWNKGMKMPPETRKKISESNNGKISWNKGEKMSEKAKRNMSKAQLKIKNHLGRFKKGHPFYGDLTKPNYFQKGEQRNPNYLKNIILYQFQSKEKHWNWQGGIMREPYSFDFNEELKELIRKRDGYICQLCGITWKKEEKRLPIHHIDYDKKNSNPDNLITLCCSCNIKVNQDRDYWTNRFQKQISIINFLNQQSITDKDRVVENEIEQDLMADA